MLNDSIFYVASCESFDWDKIYVVRGSHKVEGKKGMGEIIEGGGGIKMAKRCIN